MKHPSDTSRLVLAAARAHCVLMRTALLLVPLGIACWAQAASGIWKLNAAQSTFAGHPPPKTLTVRIEPHVKGEVFTLDRIEADGRTVTCSIVLYLDGRARDFSDSECSGTQSSRRIDSRTIEILRNCGPSAWIRFVRRTAPKNQLVLEVSEQRTNGRRFERRLVFEKQ